MCRRPALLCWMLTLPEISTPCNTRRSHIPSPVLQIRLPEDVLEAVVIQASKDEQKPSEWVRNLILNRLGQKAAEPLVPESEPVRPTIEPRPIAPTQFVTCGRGFCRGVIKPNGRCSLCNQRPR